MELLSRVYWQGSHSGDGSEDLRMGILEMCPVDSAFLPVVVNLPLKFGQLDIIR
jgi:hypothetical protein